MISKMMKEDVNCSEDGKIGQNGADRTEWRKNRKKKKVVSE